MRSIVFPCLLLFFQIACSGQATNQPLLDEVKKKLDEGSLTVSDVLTDNKYSSLHPETPFRELIEEHATSAILKITHAGEPGKKIRVLGTITNKEGNPVKGALVYIYQTDAKGWYAAGSPHVGGSEGDMRHARIFGYVKTDENGKFELHTVKPSGYPSSDLPAHIHVHVTAAGFNNYINEFLFDDDERLVGHIREQSVRNRFHISKPGTAGPGFDQQFSYIIRLE